MLYFRVGGDFMLALVPFILYSLQIMKSTKKRRYAVRLLFQFRVEKKGKTNQKRLCEDRIATFYETKKKLILRVVQYAANSQFDYYSEDGSHVYFEFVGITGLVDMTCYDDNQVWTNVFPILQPMERKEKLTLSDEELSQILNNEPEITQNERTKYAPKSEE